MIHQDSLLVTLVKLVDRIPMPPPPVKRGRGRPRFYPDRLFLKSFVESTHILTVLLAGRFLGRFSPYDQSSSILCREGSDLNGRVAV